MSRRKSTTTSVLRRSARLASLQNRGKPAKDLIFGSEPPRKIRRELGPPKTLVFKEGSKSPEMDGFPSLRRGFSESSKDKSSQCSSTKPASVKSSNVSCSCTLRRSPRFSSGGGGSVDCPCSSESGKSVLSRCSKKPISSENGKGGGDRVKSRDTIRTRSRSRPNTKHMFRGFHDDEEDVSLRVSEGKRMRIAKPSKVETVVAKADEQGEEKRFKTKKKLEKGCTEEVELGSRTLRPFTNGGGPVDASSKGRKSSNSVLSRCSKKAVSSERVKADGVKTRDRSRLRPKTKQMYRDCDEEEEEEEDVRVCLCEEEKAVPKPEEGKRIRKEEEGEGLKTKNKVAQGWSEELEIALQGAYLTVKPSPNFWKKVSKMVPGKSAQECFDRVNSDLNTPRQHQPRSRATKTNLSPIPQFSLSASKLLKPNSPKTKIRHRRNNLSKKTIRHLLEKQNHMDQGLGFDLFSVFEPGTTSNLLSTPVEKGQRLPKILESPLPCSRFASKDKTTLVSPPVLKQVKNKALHEKYIDHLHIREAKRKAESTRLSRKENIRPLDDNQKKDSVRTVKDSLFFDVQDAIQKLKGLEAEKSSSSSDFGCETDEEDEFI